MSQPGNSPHKTPFSIIKCVHLLWVMLSCSRSASVFCVWWNTNNQRGNPLPHMAVYPAWYITITLLLRPALRGQLDYPEHDVRHHWYFETDCTVLKHSSSLLLEHMSTSVCSQVSFSTVIPNLTQMDDYEFGPMHDVMILLSRNQTPARLLVYIAAYSGISGISEKKKGKWAVTVLVLLHVLFNGRFVWNSFDHNVGMNDVSKI